ncbi:MAG: site-specific integrase [Bacilli bacterium]
MPYYKNKDKDTYFVKVCIHGKQIIRRQYLGRPITSVERAVLCEQDLLIQFNEIDLDYNLNDLNNLFEAYLFNKYKETSAKRYLYTFRNVFKRFFDNRKISNITRSYCELLNDSINKLPYKRLDVYFFILKVYLNFLSNYGLKINTNLFYKYKCSRNIIIKHDFYSFNEFKKLLSVTSDDTYYLMFSLLFYYGLRIGELRALQVSDCMSDRLSISKELTNKARFGGQKVLDPKTSSSYRYYPYLLDINNLINKLIKDNHLKQTDFLFLNKESNKIIGESTIRRKLLYYSSLANIKAIKIHEFRHSCATFLINKNVDPKDIASWLGHSSVETTLRVYAHLLPVRKEQVKRAFESASDTIDTTILQIPNKKLD